MPKALADGRIKLTILTKKPADPKAPTVDELNAGINAACQILKSDYKLGATASDTISEAALCSVGNATTYGASNYEGSITPFVLKDETGKTDMEESTAYAALAVKGTTLWLVEREGPEESTDYAAGDIVDVYEVVTDTPQKPGERSGWIKRTVPLGVQQAWENVEVASDASA